MKQLISATLNSIYCTPNFTTIVQRIFIFRVCHFDTVTRYMTRCALHENHMSSKRTQLGCAANGTRSSEHETDSPLDMSETVGDQHWLILMFC